jgi:hypothetical protein
MGQLRILNLNCFEICDRNNGYLTGGYRITPSIATPRISTAAATDSDTKLTTFAGREGNLIEGFRTNIYARGSAASAASAAVSINGQAYAEAYANAG